MTTINPNHQTHCCGMGYIYGFYDVTEGSLRTLDSQLKAWPTGRTLEATLTDQQMMKWAPELEKRSFKLVHRFRNSNSGNYVNVLLFCKSRARKAPPYEWGKQKKETTFKKVLDKVAPKTPQGVK